MSDFLVKVRGESRGPYTAAQLLTQIRRKRLSRQHPVSSDGGVSWQRAGELDSLFPATSGGEANAQRQDNEPTVQEHAQEAASNSEPQWTYSAMGQQMGPIPESEVRMLIASGGIQSDTLLWQDGMTDWVEVQHIPTFAAANRSRQSSESPKPTERPAAFTANVAADKSLHWPSLAALLTAVAAWTLLLPGGAFSLGLSGVLSGRLSSAEAGGILALLLSIALALSPCIMCCVISLTLGHKAVKYANREPGQYDGTVYAIFALILGYIVAVAVPGLIVVCLIGASR